jgi:hypothetical protein
LHERCFAENGHFIAENGHFIAENRQKNTGFQLYQSQNPA